MIIRMERSGGMMGMPLRAEIDTAHLPAGEGQGLARLVESAGFFDLPAQIAPSGKSADRFQYQLTVEDGSLLHTVSLGEADAPPDLQALIRQVTRLARASR